MPDFVTYCLQNTRNAVLDNLIFQNFPGEDAPGPPYKYASAALVRSTYDHPTVPPIENHAYAEPLLYNQAMGKLFRRANNKSPNERTMVFFLQCCLGAFVVFKS